MTPLASMLPPAKRDELLAELLDRLAEDQRAGRVPDPAATARDHPELADDLKDLWAVAQFAGLARQPGFDSATASTHTLPAPSDAPPTTTAPAALPREFGDFELLGELGRGGMGVVYKARQKSLNRIIALKMVREAHLATADDRARFRTEAEAAARLKHPNIVTVHEVGTVDGQAYFCMEFVGGQTLAQKVAADGPFPPREAARLVRPERPEVTVLAAPPGATFEPLEVGWLTYRLGPDWLDVVVRIDPREPYGFVRLEFDGGEAFADAAGEALAGYAAVVETRDLDATAAAAESP